MIDATRSVVETGLSRQAYYPVVSGLNSVSVIPAQAGNQRIRKCVLNQHWVPACAGMTSFSAAMTRRHVQKTISRKHHVRLANFRNNHSANMTLMTNPNVSQVLHSGMTSTVVSERRGGSNFASVC